MGFKLKYLKCYAWGVSQFLIGADRGKQQLHFDTLRPFPGAKILDVGCASGNASAIFKDFDYTGIDVDADAIDCASYRFRHCPNMHFLCLDLHRYDRPNYFDYIIFGSTGHHIPRDAIVPLLRKFGDLLKPGGIIGVFDQVKTGREGPCLRLSMSIDRGKFHKTMEEYLGLFAEAGLKVVEQRLATVKGPCLTYPNSAVFKLTVV